jgi:hypothetical protein
MVSVKSTEEAAPEGDDALACPFVEFLAEAGLAAGATGSGLVPSSFTALLEITNRRRTGGPFNLGAFGLLLRLVCGMFFAAVALRFNIYNQTNEPAVGSEIQH